MKFVWDHLKKPICVLLLGFLAQMASVSGSTAFAQTIFAYAGTGVAGSFWKPLHVLPKPNLIECRNLLN